MGILHKKRRTTGEEALAYRGKGGQNTDIVFPALGLRAVLYLPILRSLFSDRLPQGQRVDRDSVFFCLSVHNPRCSWRPLLRTSLDIRNKLYMIQKLMCSMAHGPSKEMRRSDLGAAEGTCTCRIVTRDCIADPLRHPLRWQRIPQQIP